MVGGFVVLFGVGVVVGVVLYCWRSVGSVWDYDGWIGLFWGSVGVLYVVGDWGGVWSVGFCVVGLFVDGLCVFYVGCVGCCWVWAVWGLLVGMKSGLVYLVSSVLILEIIFLGCVCGV